jgi:MinD-like ATPase involved in chromosome partitioning or flagellar assembly
VASGENAASAERDAPARFGAVAGAARWARSGLRTGLGRWSDRGSAPPASPPEAAPSSEASPSAVALPPAEAAAQATPAWLQAPAMSSKPQARWMLRVQPRPGAAPALDRPGPAESALPEQALPEQALPEQAGPAPAAPEASAAAATVELTAPGVPAPQTPAPEPAPELPALPALEVTAPEATTPEGTTPEAAAPEAALEAAAPEPAAPEPAAPEPAAPAATPPAPPEPSPAADPTAPALAETGSAAIPPAAPAPAPAAARFVSVERERPVPSVERALSGPGSRPDASWRRQVRVVAGGHGPGKRDQEALDRDRARLPLAGPRLIAVLGCTRGAGQTVTTLMTSHILAAVRGVPVAALDLNPGATSLAARRAPAASARALLAGQEPNQPGLPGQSGRHAGLLAGRGPGGRFDVIADLAGAHALDPDDYQRLAALLAERYQLTMVDPAPAGLTRVLASADQLVLVAPASPDAATSLANTQQWLGAHGYGELAGRAVTVVNGVSRRTMEDVRRAESVARGRCRAIVRVPWDDLLAARPGSSPTLQPQTRLAYTALAGVLMAGLAAAPASPVPERNPGEHSD